MRALLLLLFAFPLTARVISYAPYTSRVADPAFQDRTARHFVLVETAAENYFSYWVPNELVLYDSKGEEEPRVISPRSNLLYVRSALYEPEGKAPVILAMTTRELFVSEGGADWKTVRNLTNNYNLVDTLDFDFGGGFTHGPFGAITIGNDRWPFIVTIASGGVWAIDRKGEAKKIFDAGARAIGRNARGDRFLIQFGRQIFSASPDGELAKVGDLPGNGYNAGWLKSDGTAYIVSRTSSQRLLFKSTPTLKMELLGGAQYSSAPETGSTIPRLRYFAVPTHDYEGAWIIARTPGQPTTLHRHTSALGMEEMWSDVTGPEVEALIPGRSGETVLVQVHRERDRAELNRPIIDPALAVWRVGQRAPKVYEELYLNENWNKGFVRVDADRIESGDNFVFDSGYILVEPTPSRVSAPIGGGGDVLQEWGVVRASFQQRLVLPGVARLRGAFASFWTTDVTIYNPLAEQQNVEVRFAPMDGQPQLSASLILEPHEIRAVRDVLKTLFALDSGGGALHLVPAAGVNAVARTYTTRQDGGTYGFGMQAVDASNSIGPRFTATFAGAFPNDNFRTNVLLTDTSGRGAEATLSARTQYGSRSTTKNAAITALPQTTGQMNAAHGEVGLNALEGASLVVEPKRGSAIASVVAIDNRTNDPTYFPPDLPAGTPRTIPLLAHIDGPNGEKIRSDLYIINASPRYRTLQLQARLWDTDNTLSTNYYLDPYESVVIPDVMITLFRRSGRAQLRFSGWSGETGGDSVRVTSRTYTVAGNGGTYGSLVPPLNGFQIGTQGDRLEILGISAGPGFRTNIGLVDLAAMSSGAQLRLSIIDHTGKTLDVMNVQLQPRGGMLLEDIFTARGITPPPASMLVVEISHGDQVGAFATLTDDITHDSIYLGANLGAQPEAN